MRGDDLVCWRCGATLVGEPIPLSRYAVCAQCGADLHACRLCAFYDTRVARACREPVAEEVKEKERANFCGYFTPRPDAYVARETGAAETSRAELESLFGLPGGSSAAAPSEPDAARAALDRLFGLDANDGD